MFIIYTFNSLNISFQTTTIHQTEKAENYNVNLLKIINIL